MVCSNKKVIAVDCDDVLALFVPSLIAFHNYTYGSSLELKNFHSYEFYEVWGGTAEECMVKMHEFFESEYFSSMQPVAGAYDCLKELSEYYEFHIVTARQHFLEERTRAWIDAFFPGIFKDLHFGNHYGEGKRISKPEFCRAINAELLIDDAVKHARACSEAGIKTILFGDYAWNQLKNDEEDLDAKMVHRVSSWNEVKEILLPLKM
eukprot:GCRY01000675.1.p1 GENE.GCRY01000675.1~~GCRY01000675.1.p1  ORF type:complete len:207 (+),score=31.63 GCRY01000675.1:175-795(+)